MTFPMKKTIRLLKFIVESDSPFYSKGTYEECSQWREELRRSAQVSPYCLRVTIATEMA